MRLFVALPIAAELRRAAAAAAERVREAAGEGLRWPRPEGYHVTLAFLGEVAPERVDEVTGVLDRVAAGTAPLEMTSGAAGRFGRGVLWLGVDSQPPGRVAQLGEQVQSALAAARLPVKEQEVHPHITLARGGKRKVTDALVDAVSVPQVAWTVPAIELWSSQLGDGPARYAVEHKAALDG